MHTMFTVVQLEEMFVDTMYLATNSRKITMPKPQLDKEIIKLDYDKNNIWHIEPINDLDDHNTDGIECHCNPKLQIQDNGGLVVVHNSYDGREMEEYGRKPN